MFFYVTAAVILILVTLWVAWNVVKDSPFPIVAETIIGLLFGGMAMCLYCAIIVGVFTEATDTDTETYTLVALDGEQGALVRIDMQADGDRGRVEYSLAEGGDRIERSRPSRLVNIVESDGEATVTVTSYTAKHPLWWPFESTATFENSYTLTVPADKVIVEMDR